MPTANSSQAVIALLLLAPLHAQDSPKASVISVGVASVISLASVMASLIGVADQPDASV